MKLIIASDIHGNIIYTKKLAELIDKEQPEKIILLGDLLSSYGMDYDEFDRYEVANVLNKYANKIISVQGNCDGYEDNELLCFDNSKKSQVFEVDGLIFYLMHGHLFNNYLSTIDNTYILCGHTHRYNMEGTIINPGSVGMPRGGNNHTCIIYNNKNISLFDLDDNKIIETRELL